MTKHLIKLPRSSMRTWAFTQLTSKQDGKCLVCGKPIDLTVKGSASDYVVDHCHETGQIRAVLHRSCNAALGKIDNAAGRWGAKSMSYTDIVPYLRKVVEYYEWVLQNPTGMLYPDHKSKDERQDLARLRRNKAAALRRAKIKQAKEDAKNEL